MEKVNEVDLYSKSDEIQDQMLDLYGLNIDLYNAMMKDENVFNCFINNSELFEIFKENPIETKMYLENQLFFNRLLKAPEKTLETIKKSIVKQKENSAKNTSNQNKNINQLKNKDNNLLEGIENLDSSKNEKNETIQIEEKENLEEISNIQDENNKKEEKLDNKTKEEKKKEEEKEKNNIKEEKDENSSKKKLSNAITEEIKKNKANNDRNQNNSLRNQQCKDNAKADNDIYFIIIILQNDFEDIIPLVNSQSKDFQCTILNQSSYIHEGENYFKILYNTKLEKNSRNCTITLHSKKNKKSFNNEKQNIINEGGVTIILEDFDFQPIQKWTFFTKTINPPKTLKLQNFLKTYDSFFSYSLMIENEKFQKQLLKKGFEKIKSIQKKKDSKFSINLFIEILSFVLKNIEEFSEVISFFDINFIKDNEFLKNVNPIFQELLKVRETFVENLKPELVLNLDSLISFGFLILPGVKQAVEFISKSSYKENLVNNIIENLEYFKENIYEMILLNFLLKNCNRKENIVNNIISKSLNFRDYIDLVYDNIELFKDIKFDIHCKDFLIQEYGQEEKIIPKIISILKNCPKSSLNGCSFLTKYPNFIEKISKEERKELYQLLGNNDPIKKLIIEKGFKDVNNNEDIIDLIETLVLWNYPDRYDVALNQFNKFNFENITSQLFEKFKKIFKNFEFYSMAGFYKENNYDKKTFQLILNKCNNIYQISDVLWSLFRSNIVYNFSQKECEEFLARFWELFSINEMKDIRNDLYKITNHTFLWCIKNIQNPKDFLLELEKQSFNSNNDEKKINDSYITKLYIDFLAQHYKEQPIEEYLINYLKIRIIQLDKESMEKILNVMKQKKFSNILTNLN